MFINQPLLENPKYTNLHFIISYRNVQNHIQFNTSTCYSYGSWTYLDRHFGVLIHDEFSLFVDMIVPENIST